MKKAASLFLVLALVFSFTGCSIAPTNIEKEDSTVVSKPITQHISHPIEEWIASCLKNGKTDSISCTSSDSISNINLYFQQELIKSKHMPCYYSIFETKEEGNFFLKISFDGILLKDIISNYSFDDFCEGYFMIRTVSDLDSIAELITEVYGKNTDFSVLKTEICDGTINYYNVNIVS